jgi:4-amino-4-deoxy-L-arabinose transferase-like glycosyltransferase
LHLEELIKLYDGERKYMSNMTRKGHRILAFVFVSICYSTFLWWQQDDFYIHLQYAKNFSQTFIWAFNLGIPSYGTTSPLWVLLLSCFGVVKLDLLIVAKLFSLVLGIVTFILIFYKARPFTDKYLFYLCMMSIGLNHWYRLAVGSGMEAALASVLITILFFRTYHKIRSDVYSFINGVIIGLCVLVRPEFVYIIAIFIFVPLFEKKVLKEKLSNLLILLSGIFIVLCPWIIFAEVNFHSIIPTTILVKTGG